MRITEAKKNLQEGLPYLRYAIERAKASGEVKLAIVSKQPDGSGKIFCEFDVDDFISDICVLAEVGDQTEEQNLDAKAHEFLHSHGLKSPKQLVHFCGLCYNFTFIEEEMSCYSLTKGEKQNA